MGYLIRSGVESVFQHVTARGVDKQAIYRSTTDYIQYLKILGIYAKQHRTGIHAYCLMPNHIHFLVRPNGDMSNFIRDLHAAYARWFNEKYERVGHLFQRRFHSKPILSNEHILQVGRYIHMNPVAANIVSDPIQYPWSSFKYFNSSDSPPWLNLRILLKAHQ